MAAAPTQEQRAADLVAAVQKAFRATQQRVGLPVTLGGAFEIATSPAGLLGAAWNTLTNLGPETANSLRELRRMEDDIAQWERQQGWAKAGRTPQGERYTWGGWEAEAEDLLRRMVVTTKKTEESAVLAPVRQEVDRKAKEVVEAVGALGDKLTPKLPKLELPGWVPVVAVTLTGAAALGALALAVSQLRKL